MPRPAGVGFRRGDAALPAGKLAILLAGALIIEQRQRRLRLQPVARAEQLPQRMVGHLFAVAIGGLLNVLAEVLLQPAGQFQTMILFDKPGAAALPDWLLTRITAS